MAVNRDFADNYTLAGGELFVKLAGESNFRYFGQTNEVKINYASTRIEHKNSESSIVVTDADVTKEIEAGISFTTDDLNTKTLAIAFNGDYTTTSQDAGSITDETISAVAKGLVYELTKRKVSNVVVKDTDDTVYTENTDYSVNATFGTIEIAEDGGLDGKDIKVSYDHEAVEVTSITSLDKTSQEFSLRFVSNPQSGKPKQTTIHRVRLALNGDYALKDLENYTSISLEGKVLKDTTKAEGKQFVETVIVG